MRTVAIIQARMGSTRLPGKILMPLAGKPVLQHVVQRVRASGAFDAVVVATTDQPIDDVIAERAPDFGAMVVRGDEQDVLSRFGLAAKASGADAIMRITADCPLIDPQTLAAMVERFRGGDVDIVSNCVRRTYPRGLDAELFSRATLDRLLATATSVSHREHVTLYFYDHPDGFRIASFEHDRDLSALRLTLDTPEDFELLEKIFQSTPNPDALRLDDVVAIMAANPDCLAINAHIEQNKN